MAKKKTKKKNPHTASKSKRSWKLTRKQKVVFGSFLMLFSVALIIAFVSFLISWKIDYSSLNEFRDRTAETANWLSKFGVQISYLLMYKGFGIAAFSLAVLIGLTGIFLFFNLKLKQLLSYWIWGLFLMIWGATCFGFLAHKNALLGGMVGFETNDFLQDYTGFIGTVLILLFVAIFYLVIRLNITPELIGHYFNKTKKEVRSDFKEAKSLSEEPIENDSTSSLSEDQDNSIKQSTNTSTPEQTEQGPEEDEDVEELEYAKNEQILSTSTVNTKSAQEHTTDNDEDDVAMEVKTVEEETIDDDEDLSEKIVRKSGEYDPRLDLSDYKFPTVDLLIDYSKGAGGITINQEELEENKDKIVNTLKNYKIGISKIKATVGPTVTLYEIVPEAGIRISKIRNLEDDIALSLAALGIRIIAPIPGKGTIGIEVPNKNPSIVSMRSVLSSPKFKNAEMQLPVALGKTISNETFVVDLVKMPHLLMAGATGQGKSVGLNAILTSLLYRKHPAEIKFVLVDPKKVELTLYNKIERHFLAKLPNKEEAIITDNTQVINTLNSLCKEMDDRYDLLKKAMVRNIKEYNVKFKKRKLNPENGHRYLPYIVLVIDEFADLIMTAGKEVETPIARLAQLARAIGIHLIIATQRPSVNVITGMIKANFPGRIAFRVTSKIDSRTILDSGGADQLIGRGDMLFTQGNTLTRLQCAFVDTPEVDEITDFIGSQRAYPQAFQLPEYEGEESGTGIEDNLDERDSKFREAAEIIVSAQQGSASLLQRKLRLGYNRAGRIIDQLEAAGIVGPFQGSKARDVLITDLASLDEFLDNPN